MWSLKCAARDWKPALCGHRALHGALRIRRRSARVGAGSARDVEDAVPYEAPSKTKRRAGTCAPPFHRLNAAAHGWPPYHGNDRIRRRSACWVSLSCRTTDGRPYGASSFRHAPSVGTSIARPRRTDENPAPLPGEPVPYYRVIFFLHYRTISDRLVAKRTPHMFDRKEK